MQRKRNATLNMELGWHLLYNLEIQTLITLLAGHDVEHQSVCFVHTLRADAGKVADTAVHIVIDDTFYRCHTLAFHGEDSREHGSRYAAGELQRTTWLRTVANHTGDVGNHVLHRIGNLLIITAHEVGDTTAGASGCYHTTA